MEPDTYPHDFFIVFSQADPREADLAREIFHLLHTYGMSAPEFAVAGDSITLKYNQCKLTLLEIIDPIEADFRVGRMLAELSGGSPPWAFSAALRGMEPAGG